MWEYVEIMPLKTSMCRWVAWAYTCGGLLINTWDATYFFCKK